MSHPHRPDPYASEAESAALLVPDTRTPAERTLDALLDEAYYNEQGAEPVLVLRRVALELVEKMAARVPLTEAEILWLDHEPHAVSDKQLIAIARAVEAAHGITKGTT